MPSKDFTANQIRVTKLIASGGLSGGGAQTGNNIGIAIYSASNASDIAGGITDSSMLDKVGKDVFMFVSGNIGGSNTDGGSITVFGGDVHVSGSLSTSTSTNTKYSAQGYGELSGATNGRLINWINEADIDVIQENDNPLGYWIVPFNCQINKIIFAFTDVNFAADRAGSGVNDIQVRLFKNQTQIELVQISSHDPSGPLVVKITPDVAGITGNEVILGTVNFSANTFAEGDILGIATRRNVGDTPVINVKMVYEAI